MTWRTTAVVNNSPKTVSGSAWTLGFRGGGGQIEVQGYGRVDIIDRGWSDQYQAWSVQIGDNPQVWIYQGEGSACFQIDDGTPGGDGVYLTLAGSRNQGGPPNVGPFKVMVEVPRTA